MRVLSIVSVCAFAFSANVATPADQIVNGNRVVCEGGVCRLVPTNEIARTSVQEPSSNQFLSLSQAHSATESGITTKSQVETKSLVEENTHQSSNVARNQSSNLARHRGPRVAQGYMPAEAFLAFLEGEAAPAFVSVSLWVTLLLILLGGVALNLTPCVLPMIPINLIIIGRSAARGAAYGLGMTVAYGTLGLLAALGGTTFGGFQGNPWFNAAVALVFVALALALFDVFFIDLSRFRPQQAPGASAAPASPLRRVIFPFVMGALAAVLAGACVAPILISVLLLTAKWYGEGQTAALALPFVLGLGMALPWPFLGAGMRVLPRPGAWMKSVNRVFGCVVLAFAVWYGQLAVRGFSGSASASADGAAILPDALPAALARAERPILVDCGASWCKNCAAMERVLQEPRVQAALARYTVIRVKAENLADLRRVKGFEAIQGLPAFVVFD